MTFWFTLSDMSSQENFSINAAAKLTGYSLPTIRKRLPDLQAEGAVQVDGRWAIPLSALHACGLMSKVEGLSKPAENPLHSETIKDLELLRAENKQLQAELARADAALAREQLLVDYFRLQIEAKPTTTRAGWRLFRRDE
jgi:hypothetical protein